MKLRCFLALVAKFLALVAAKGTAATKMGRERKVSFFLWLHPRVAKRGKNNSQRQEAWKKEKQPKHTPQMTSMARFSKRLKYQIETTSQTKSWTGENVQAMGHAWMIS